MSSLEEAIQQRKFRSAAHKAQVNIIYTAAWINQRTTDSLKPFGLSIQQFNVLRILRGRGDQPSTVKLLTERMLDKMSNASRLVEKLKSKGYVERRQCDQDRRRVDVVITTAGLDIIEAASEAVNRSMQDDFGGATEEECAHLSDLLDKLRG